MKKAFVAIMAMAMVFSTVSPGIAYASRTSGDRTTTSESAQELTEGQRRAQAFHAMSRMALSLQRRKKEKTAQ